MKELEEYAQMKELEEYAQKHSYHPDSNKRVGACIITSTGEKFFGTNSIKGGCHAEIEAIEKLKKTRFIAADCKILVTSHPCLECTKEIIKYKFKEVIRPFYLPDNMLKEDVEYNEKKYQMSESVKKLKEYDKQRS